MTDGMELEPLNEWIVSELSRVQAALADLTRRHEEILNHLADVCRRNDRMQTAGTRLADLLEVLWVKPGESETEVAQAICDWREADV